MIEERAYAKINLTLDIVKKRDDGFHELESLMTFIDLFDDIIYTKNDDLVYDSNVVNENEICLRIFDLLKEKYNISNVKIANKKHIPTSAGLAGGSSDAAATVRGLDRLFNLNLSILEKEEICNIVGSDVTFCLNQKTAICRGRGEKLEFLDFDFPEIPVLVIKPNFSISTALVYKNFNMNMINKDKESKKSRVLEALKTNNIKLLEDNIFNDLLLASIKSSDNLSSFINEVSNYFNAKVFLSGSGPTVFLFKFDEDKVLKYQNIHKDYSIFKTNILNVVK